MNLVRNRLAQSLLLGSICICPNAYSGDAAITYNYVDLGYVNIDIDNVLPGLDADGDGGAIRVSGAVHPNIHLFGGYTQVDLDFGVDFSAWEVGAGYNQRVAEKTDIFATVAYVDAEAEAGALSADDDGYALGVGVRHMIVTDQVRASVIDGIELIGEINYVDLDDSGDDTSGTAGILFHVDPVLAIGLEGTWSDDTSTYIAGIRIMY